MSIIDDVYARVPEVHCKGLCQAACGPIGCSGIEAAALQDKGIALPTVVDHPTAGAATCSHLSVEGRCTIYADRPLVCRLFGATKPLKCVHGCRPKSMLSRDEGHALVDELTNASDLPPYFAH